MRYATGLHRLIAVAALSALAAASVYAQSLTSDWPLHRGTTGRLGANTGSAHAGTLDQVYLWPNTRDLPAEMVVDNDPPYDVKTSARYTYPLSTGQNYATAGTWTDAPTGTGRASGAWPTTDVTTSVIGNYQYTSAVYSAALAEIGTSTLAKLPNLGTDAESAASYKAIEAELAANGATYARWSFGTAYPLGTQQGTHRVAFDTGSGVGATGSFRQPLQAGQRYAVYIRWPAAGTTVSGTTYPIVDHVLVRVSWGATVDDPKMSRLFLVNTGQTGGYWSRIRTSTEDRYFPYNGTDPIRVTLYALTPDAIGDSTQYSVTPIVTADAVRLVPEALRGDIHASAASMATTSLTGSTVRLSYFGRDETVGPLRLFQNDAYLASLKTEYGKDMQLPSAPFTGILFNPISTVNTSSSSSDFNPIIPDPTTSIRTAAFYCLEDDVTAVRYGQLRWRYTANTSEVVTSTGGTTMALPTLTAEDNSTMFTNTGFTSTTTGGTYYGTSFHQASVVAYGSATIPTATWTATLPVKGYAHTATGSSSADYWTGQTYTVMAWLPGLSTSAHYAHYQITTAFGVTNTYVDQRMVSDGKAAIGGWRIIATGVRFPFSGSNQVAVVKLIADGPSYPTIPTGSTDTEANRIDLDDVGQGRIVLADAVQFVPETLSPGSVLGAPMVSIDRQANGTAVPASRTTIHFVTDEGTAGHVWALNPFGVDAVGALKTSTLTTANWVYPSLLSVNNDPNYLKTSNSNARNAIDGEWDTTTVSGVTSYTISNGMPAVSGFRSSPIYIEQSSSTSTRNEAFNAYLLMGNQNGRLYGIDPTGRADQIAASGDLGGTPGTTTRLLTWPSAARDRYRVSTGSFSKFSNEAGKTYIKAAPAAHTTDANNLCDLVVVGAGGRPRIRV